ncbi:MAG: hypothetical protein CSB55_08325 [Candidatus Cloacimonadota bacterium]|nr:MAG: hypothetical protein CSB55_08325 [Candidatus Cloacimonadota bacterium]
MITVDLSSFLFVAFINLNFFLFSIKASYFFFYFQFVFHGMPFIEKQDIFLLAFLDKIYRVKLLIILF